jgi:hypothetical protein
MNSETSNSRNSSSRRGGPNVLEDARSEVSSMSFVQDNTMRVLTMPENDGTMAGF